MRKLASIQKIKDLQPIEGADMIEKATVLGWQLVVKKGEFNIGDYCIYCEIDSILPEKPAFEFLRPRHFRIRTVKMRGQISQGIAFPMKILTEDNPVLFIESDTGEYGVGIDVTEYLGITKYEVHIPANMRGVIKGNFPSFIPKTSEKRIQSIPQVLDKYMGTVCNITEKLDGTSATYYIKDGEFGVCSRNMELKETDSSLYWQVARKQMIEEKLRGVGYNIAIQGEIIGPGVQGNKYKLDEHKLYVFNVFDIDKYSYSSLGKIDLTPVPSITHYDTYTIGKGISDTQGNVSLGGLSEIDYLINIANSGSIINSKSKREGIVVRPLKEINDERHGRLSFKVISPKFLLKYE